MDLGTAEEASRCPVLVLIVGSAAKYWGGD
ncbi:unnamed protein product [Hydatigera taeniaeformis]|uniref:Uncharacterized protein n=1 Tax=Hydatigena taeniaeformis TaxID=6205 RepID=A0A3P7ES21_HYDTA|nr:unnamed protein product [Hydatigera taeniaeformis]